MPFAIALLLALPAAIAAEPIADFLRGPTDARLETLQKACRNRELDANIAYGRLHEFVKNGSVLAIRALLTLQQSCASPTFSKDIVGVLGRDLFLTETKNLLEALGAEKTRGHILDQLARSMGIAEDAKRTPGKSFYQLKERALRRFPFPPKSASEKARLRMLEWLQSH